MGMANSKNMTPQIGTPEVQRIEDSPNTSVRLLEADPRSPSEEIVRTPILVDGNVKDSISWEHDPRSPSCVVMRTPLPPVSATRSISDPRSPTERIPRTPLEKIDESFFPDGVKEEPATTSSERKNELSFKILDESSKEEGPFVPKCLFRLDTPHGQRVPLRSANRPSSLRLRAIQQQTSLKQATVAPITFDPSAECITNAWCVDKENSPATNTMVI